MNRLNKVLSVFFYSFATMVVMAKPSHAYLDAGSGSMMIQLLLAGSTGMAVLAKLFWQNLLSRVRVLRGKSRGESAET
jgi:hypothetical protein